MAQLKMTGGFTRIHNELIDRVFAKVNFPAHEMRIIWAIIRMSWGWNQPGCYTSYRELAEKTGIELRDATKAVKRLIEKQIIIPKNSKAKTYLEINTDYMTWQIPEAKTLFTVGCTSNTPSNKALDVDPTPAVGCTSNAESSETLDRQWVEALLKKTLKKLNKESDFVSLSLASLVLSV